MSDELMVTGTISADPLLASVSRELVRVLKDKFESQIYAELKTYLADNLRHIDLAPVVRDAAHKVIAERLPITNFGGLGFNEFLAGAMRDYLVERLAHGEKK